jgi:hypothetical protein
MFQWLIAVGYSYIYSGILVHNEFNIVVYCQSQVCYNAFTMSVNLANWISAVVKTLVITKNIDNINTVFGADKI